MNQIRWTKQCECRNFIPSEYKICDYCLLAKYGLENKGEYKDWRCVGQIYYTQEDIVEALRNAEKENK